MVATELISLRIAPHGQAWGGQHTISPPPLPIFRCTLQDQIPRKSCPPSWAAGDVFLGSWTFRDTSHSSHAEDAVAAWTPPANPLSPFALWQVFFFLKHSQTSQQVFCKGWVSPIPLFFWTTLYIKACCLHPRPSLSCCWAFFAGPGGFLHRRAGWDLLEICAFPPVFLSARHTRNRQVLILFSIFCIAPTAQCYFAFPHPGSDTYDKLICFFFFFVYFSSLFFYPKCHLTPLIHTCTRLLKKKLDSPI